VRLTLSDEPDLKDDDNFFQNKVSRHVLTRHPVSELGWCPRVGGQPDAPSELWILSEPRHACTQGFGNSPDGVRIVRFDITVEKSQTVHRPL